MANYKILLKFSTVCA